MKSESESEQTIRPKLGIKECFGMAASIKKWRELTELLEGADDNTKCPLCDNPIKNCCCTQVLAHILLKDMMIICLANDVSPTGKIIIKAKEAGGN